MKLRVAGTIISILLIYTLVNGYIWWNLSVYWEDGLGHPLPLLLTVVLWAAAFSYMASWLARGRTPVVLAEGMKLLGSFWFGILQYAVLILPVADAIGVILHLSGQHRSSFAGGLGTAALVVLALILARGLYNAWNPVIRRFELEVQKPAGHLQRIRIAAASDIHLGAIVRRRYLEKLAGIFEELSPDLILFPGDVIDDDIAPFIRQRMEEVMAGIHAPLGVYAVLGNHEYIGGHIEEFAERMGAAGVRVLMDESVELADGALILIGRKDKAAESFRGRAGGGGADGGRAGGGGADGGRAGGDSADGGRAGGDSADGGRAGDGRVDGGRAGGGRLPLSGLMEGLDTSKPLLLLDHQPYNLGTAADAGIDLMLSGHTHRGQMAPNHWITGRLFELDWGYLRKGKLHAIVSSGYGTWGPPLRLGSRSEVLDITLVFTGEKHS